MAQSLRSIALLSLAAYATLAGATFHTYRIDQIYSNADGTVQYVVLRESMGMDGENELRGHQLTSMGPAGTASYTFPRNLPGGSCGYYECMPSPTANTRVLIATQGFVDLGLIAPDYVIPNGFLALGGGTLDYAGADQWTYGPLPADGTSALYRTGAVAPNRATNFFGISVSISAPSPTKPDLNQHGLSGSWYEPATDGQGFEVEVFPDLVAAGTGSVQVSWFTFDTVAGGASHQRWYTLSGHMVSGQPNASLTIFQNTGGNFNAPPITNGVAVGMATLSFDTCTSGQLSYTFTDGSGRAGSIPLTRITQNVTCSATSARPTNADFAFSGNWYNSLTSGQGFAVEVNPNNGSVFVPWYTYAPAGASAGAAGQRWYTASGAFATGSRSIPVQIYETNGGVFDAPTVPPPAGVVVGTGTLAFQSCSTGTFSFNFTAGSSSGMSGSIALTRIGPVPAGCVH
jgi:hypothetical protein